MHRSIPWTRLAWAEPFWIAMLAPSVLFPGRFWILDWHPFLVLALFLFWPIRRLAYGQFTVRTPVDMATSILTVWLVLSLWVSTDVTRSWTMAGYLCLGLAGYYMLVNWPPTRHRPHYIAALLMAVGLGLLVLGPLLVTSRVPLFHTIGIEPLRLQLSHILGEAINANVWAGALLLVIPIYAGLAISPSWSRFGWMRPLMGLLALASITMLMVTDSRSAYIALLLSLLTLVVLRWPKSLYLLVPLLIAGLIALVSIGTKPVFDYLFIDARLSGWSGRPELWFRAVSAIQDFPWTGIGLGLFDQVIPVLYPYFVLGDSIEHAHNLFLQIGVDMGVPGMAAYLAIVLTVFAALSRPLRRPWRHQLQEEKPTASEQHRQVRLWALAAGLTAALVAMLVHGIMDAVTWGTKLAFLPWMLFALAINIRLNLDRRRRRRRIRRSSSESTVVASGFPAKS